VKPQPLDIDIVTPCTFAIHGDRNAVVKNSTLVKASEVIWLPWSVLKLSGLRYFSRASFTTSMQKVVSMVIDSRHASSNDDQENEHNQGVVNCFPDY
jgi:hypothetical protein